MKILREGKADITMEVECDSCDALLEIEPADVVYYGDNDRLEPKELFNVRCACCSNVFYIKKEKMSSDFYKQVKINFGIKNS